MNLRFNKRDINAVVHIVCGDQNGTAFFVGNRTLLTARHTVTSVIDKNEASVKVFFNDACYDATAHSECPQGERVDIARLELSVDVVGVKPLNLLATEFNEHPEFIVSGYPSAAGIGEVASWYEVIFEHPLYQHPFSTHTANISEIYSVQSLKGISGGPVFNECGSVVGIATYQQGRSLGFLSIRKYLDLRNTSTIYVETNAEREDYTQYGLGRSIELTKIAIESVGNRYNENNNVENRSLSNKLAHFIDYKGANQVAENIRTKESEVASFFEKAGIPSPSGDFISAYEQLDAVQKKKFIPRNNGDTIDNCIAILRNLYDASVSYAQQFMLLKGKAGTGKTHSLCCFLDTLETDANRYLLLGSHFSTNEDLINQIYAKLGFSINGFQDLDAAMMVRNTWAVLVIDALNEGANEQYWRGGIIELSKVLFKYKHIKLIVSVREPYDKTIFAEDSAKDWIVESVNGFLEIDEAISIYLSKANIPIDRASQYRQELKNPLFMNIFCKTFNSLTLAEQNDLKKIDLFENYLKVRNGSVSAIADEDPHLQITLKMVQKLCHYSVFYNYCDLVLRSKARTIGSHIVPRNGWRNSLLNAMISEGILLENISDNLEDDLVQVEYEKMGDYMKAKELLSSKMDNDKLIDLIADMYRQVSKPDYSGNATKFSNMLAALFALWGDDANRSNHNLIEDVRLKQVIDSYCGVLKDEKGICQNELIDYYYQNARPIDVDGYWTDRKTKTIEELKALHSRLLNMAQAERDLLWTEPVNLLFDRLQESISIFNLYLDEKDGEEKMLIFYGWLLASSYPLGRCSVTRILCEEIILKPELAFKLLEMFRNCRDPYVIQGVLAAVYGVCIQLHDKDFSYKVAELVQNFYVRLKSAMLDDLLVRQWALKILENADYENRTDKFYHILKYPLTDTETPLSVMDLTEDKADKNVFGESNGSLKLWYSLYDFSDFRRYIIGTNNRSHSDVFYVKNTNGEFEGISLNKILNFLKNKILENGWSDYLGVLDNTRYSNGRYDNTKERIGKKYQWMALHNLEGRLLDYVHVKRYDHYESNPQVDDFLKRPMPWHTGDDSRFDPTLKEPSKVKESAPVLFEMENHEVQSVNMLSKEWLHDVSKMPKSRYVYHDKNGDEWILLMGYDDNKLQTTDGDVNEFIFYNSGLVPNDKVEEMRQWASKVSFYGRWMPEHRNGDDHTLWNEYPWTECCKEQYMSDWQEITSDDCPSKIMLPYYSILQEHTMGLAEADDFQREILAPCADIMNHLGLRTSKYRGMIEDNAQNIVALNIVPFVRNQHNGLIIKKSILDEYLNAKGYTLFYFILGEKTSQRMNGVPIPLEMSETDLTGSALYEPEGGLEIIQPICHKGLLEPKQKKDEDGL